MKRIVLTGCCAVALTGIAFAGEPARSSSPQSPTEQWLQLQASGKAASTIPQTQAPLERDLSMQRWLDNYQHPIPEFFDQKKGGSISGGGGSSGGN